MFRDFLQNITNRLTFLDSPKPQPESAKTMAERTPEEQKKMDVRDRAKSILEDMKTRYRMEQKVDPTPKEVEGFAKDAVKKALEQNKAEESAQVESTHEAAISAGSKVDVPGFEDLIAELAKGGFDLSPDKSLQKPVTVPKHLENAGNRYAEINLKDRAALGTSEKARGDKELVTDAQKKQMMISNVLYDQMNDRMLSQAEADALNAKLETGTPQAFAEVVQYLQVNHAVASRIDGLQKVQAMKGTDSRIDAWKSANTLEGKQAALNDLKALESDYRKSHKEAADQLASLLDNSDDPLKGILES